MLNHTLTLVSQNCLFSLDLREASFLVHINENCPNYFRFVWKGQVLAITASFIRDWLLAHCCSHTIPETAHGTFTQIRLFLHYLPWRTPLIGFTQLDCVNNMKASLQFEKLGIVVHPVQSVLEPSHQINQWCLAVPVLIQHKQGTTYWQQCQLSSVVRLSKHPPPWEWTLTTSLHQSFYVDSLKSGLWSELPQARKEANWHRDWGHHESMTRRAKEAETNLSFFCSGGWGWRWEWCPFRFETTWQGRATDHAYCHKYPGVNRLRELQQLHGAGGGSARCTLSSTCGWRWYCRTSIASFGLREATISIKFSHSDYFPYYVFRLTFSFRSCSMLLFTQNKHISCTLWT